MWLFQSPDDRYDTNDIIQIEAVSNRLDKLSLHWLDDDIFDELEDILRETRLKITQYRIVALQKEIYQLQVLANKQNQSHKLLQFNRDDQQPCQMNKVNNNFSHGSLSFVKTVFSTFAKFYIIIHLITCFIHVFVFENNFFNSTLFDQEICSTI